MTLDETASILAQHQRTHDGAGSCTCARWPVSDRSVDWPHHLALVLNPPEPKPWAHPDTMIGRT